MRQKTLQGGNSTADKEAPDTTFESNKLLPIHRWYPYVEGFSGSFVEEVLSQYRPTTVLDPFCGCGTTLVESTLQGIDSIGVEINPFLAFMTRVKTRPLVNLEVLQRKADSVCDKLESSEKSVYGGSDENIETAQASLTELYHGKEYFSKRILRKLLNVKYQILRMEEGEIQDIFKLSLATILLRVSNLRRGPDLAYRKEKLYDAPIYHLFRKKLEDIIFDLRSVSGHNFGVARIFEGDARTLDSLIDSKVDLVVTSPPYLNGTNYFRNTKLELWMLDFISKERELHDLRRKAITAGINDVFASKSANIEYRFEEVDEVYSKLQEVAYDKRIPMMVLKYFDDIAQTLKSLSNVMNTGASCLWVVGDSQFANVHIPTDKLTEAVAEQVTDGALRLKENRNIRARRSRSGMKLSESILVYRKVR